MLALVTTRTTSDTSTVVVGQGLTCRHREVISILLQIMMTTTSIQALNDYDTTHSTHMHLFIISIAIAHYFFKRLNIFPQILFPLKYPI